MNISEKENLYLLAKQKYYEGEEIMSDFEFDTLEEELKQANSQVVNIVGSQSLKDAKFNHVSKMLSLNKIQVLDNNNLPFSQFANWYKGKTHEAFQFEATPKFDGSSCNLIYNGGNLEWALTRGDKFKGQNIKPKMELIVPASIDNDSKIEIRGEVVIPTNVFEAKYAHIYKNPRNFVAGILGRDDIDQEIVKDFHFVAFEVRIHTANGQFSFPPNTVEFLKRNGFITSPKTIFFGPEAMGFQYAYDTMQSFRENESPYQLDGMVIKYPENLRLNIGETDYAPKWAVAIKFPPKESITTIKEIQWSPGFTGEFTPIAVLDPVDLDGTTVSHVNLHNYGNVIRQGLFPGAKVVIVKSGDIIPIVQKVIEPATGNMDEHIPTSCSTPECTIEIQNKIHLVCTNPNCTNKLINKLSRGIGTFGFRNVAGSTIKKLYAAGIKTIQDVFDNSKFNEAELIKSGEFKKGRQLEILLQSRNNPTNKITYPLVVASLGFDNVGWSTATQIAKLFENQTPDWTGLNSAAYVPFLNTNSNEYKEVQAFIQQLKDNGFTVYSDEPVQISEDAILFEMTGSPKEFGFKTKNEFLDKVKANGWVHHRLDKDCNVLITDDLNSSSSKMAKAKKLGIEIMTYDQVINKMK